MHDALILAYNWIKAFHIIAVIAWMAGMLYLPRLFYYHSETAPGTAESERFKRMERRLLRIIVNPSMVTVWILGAALASISGAWAQGWLQAKLALVLAMSAMHGIFARWRKDFDRDERRHTQRFYALMNEVPTLLMIVIVILAVVKPF